MRKLALALLALLPTALMAQTTHPPSIDPTDLPTCDATYEGRLLSLHPASSTSDCDNTSGGDSTALCHCQQTGAATWGWVAAGTGGGGGAWNDTGDPVTLNTASKDVRQDEDATGETGRHEIADSTSDPKLVLQGLGAYLIMQEADGTDEIVALPQGILQVKGALESLAADPADGGFIAMENTDLICWEASPTGTDVCLSLSAGEVLSLTGGELFANQLDADGDGIPDLSMNSGVQHYFDMDDNGSYDPEFDHLFQTSQAAIAELLRIMGGIGSPGSIVIREQDGSGTNEIAVTVPSSMASNYTQTLQEITDTFVYRASIDSLSNKTYIDPIFSGQLDYTGTVVSDDDCTGDQGKSWWDSTDSAFEFCVNNSGVPLDLSTTVGQWSKTGDAVFLTTNTDEVVIGSSTPLQESATDSKVSIVGEDNAVTVHIRLDAGQTLPALIIEDSGGTDLIKILADGTLQVLGGGAGAEIEGDGAEDLDIDCNGFDCTLGDGGTNGWEVSDGGILSIRGTGSISGQILWTGIAVDDDDCTGDQGKMWWDSTDTQMELCNDNSGTPLIVGVSGGGGGGAFPTDADPIVPNNTGYTLNLGDAISGIVAKVEIGGDNDEIQQAIQGHSTQTNPLSRWLNNAGTTLLEIDNTGKITQAAADTPSWTGDDAQDTGTSDMGITGNCPTTNNCGFYAWVNSGADTETKVWEILTSAGVTTFEIYVKQIVDELGLEFEEGDNYTDCSAFPATGGGIWYDDSEGKLKKCEDNVPSDLDTGGAETNDLESVMTGALSGEIPIGTTAGGAAAYVSLQACAADEKLEYTDGTPDTMTCEAIGNLVDADIGDISNLAADAVDAISEIDAAIKTDDADSKLVTMTAAAPVSNECLEMDSTGTVVLAGDTCANLGPGGTPSRMQDTDNDTYVDVETAADNDEINFAAFDGTSTLTGIKIHAPATGDLQLDLGPDDVGSRTNPPLKIGDDAGLYAPANAFDVFEFVGAGGTVVAQVRADDGGLCGGQKEACLSMTGVSPGIYDWSDQNTGVDWVGADQVGFVAGSQRLFNVHRTVDDHQMTFLSDNAGNLAWDLFVIDGDADTLENEGGTDFWITKDADAHMTSFTTYAESFVDALGLEFEPGDAITDCSNFSATGGGIFYDDSEGIFKKCQDNVLSDLDTGAAGGDDVSVNGSSVTGADFDDATPAAPANAVNVNFQTSGSGPADISANVLLTEMDGVGLAVTGTELVTDSQEAGFLKDGAAVSLTCGGGAEGKMQVMDNGDLEFCDGNATSVLRKLNVAPLSAESLDWDSDGTKEITGDGSVLNFDPDEDTNRDVQISLNTLSIGGVDTASAGNLLVFEDPDNGSSSVSISPPADLTGARSQTWPDLDGTYILDATLVSDHFFYLASSFSSDGTECSDRSEKNLNGVGSPRTWTVACPMTTSETDGYVYGGGHRLPVNFDVASDFTFDLEAILVTDSGAGTWHGQIEIQCTAEGELFDTTWDATANLDLTPVVGDVVSDKITDTSASVDAATCAAGETLYWRWKSCDTDATPSTGCTSSAGFENDMELLSMTLNYKKTAGD